MKFGDPVETGICSANSPLETDSRPNIDATVPMIVVDYVYDPYTEDNFALLLTNDGLYQPNEIVLLKIDKGNKITNEFGHKLNELGLDSAGSIRIIPNKSALLLLTNDGLIELMYTNTSNSPTQKVVLKAPKGNNFLVKVFPRFWWARAGAPKGDSNEYNEDVFHRVFNLGDGGAWKIRASIWGKTNSGALRPFDVFISY